MEDRLRQSPEPQPAQSDSQRLVYVMLVVLILCGGNGVGIITAALLWKCTHLLSVAIISVVGITLAAFAGAMALIAVHNKKLNSGQHPAQPPSGGAPGDRAERK